MRAGEVTRACVRARLKASCMQSPSAVEAALGSCRRHSSRQAAPSSRLRAAPCCSTMSSTRWPWREEHVDENGGRRVTHLSRVGYLFPVRGMSSASDQRVAVPFLPCLRNPLTAPRSAPAPKECVAPEPRIERMPLLQWALQWTRAQCPLRCGRGAREALAGDSCLRAG